MHTGYSARLGLAATFVAVGMAHAGIITQVFSRAGLDANDSLDWSVLGPEGTVYAGGFTTTTSGGLPVTGSGAVNFGVFAEPNTWAGNFNPGDSVLFNGNEFDSDFTNQPLTLSFGVAIEGVGLQIDQSNIGLFIGSLTAFNGATNLGTFTVDGTMNAQNDNSAVFLGISDTAQEITSIVVTTTDGSFAINQLSLVDGPRTPEPSSFGLAALGLGLIVTACRRRLRLLA